jgi:hypothetical protein
MDAAAVTEEQVVTRIDGLMLAARVTLPHFSVSSS